MTKPTLFKISLPLILLITCPLVFAQHQNSNQAAPGDEQTLENILETTRSEADSSAAYHKDIEDENVFRHSEEGRLLREKIKKNNFGEIVEHELRLAAFESYKSAAFASLELDKIKYTNEISELAVELNDQERLTTTFSKIIKSSNDDKGRYLAYIDYAKGLAKFKNKDAEKQYLSAINMRNPTDGVEAYYRYAMYLVDNGRPEDALVILNRFSSKDRQFYFQIALLRQKLMHQLNLDTNEADKEVDKIREKFSESSYIELGPKINTNSTSLKNFFGVDKAFAFSHNEVTDDTRGAHAGDKFQIGYGYYTYAGVINAAEVVYNEARGETQAGQIAVAWAIRNRFNINMNGCDFYAGAKGHGHLAACISATPVGPNTNAAPLYQKASCAIHGGTSTVGASHKQMNDGHVEHSELFPTNIQFVVLQVFSGWTPDPTSANTPGGIFHTNATHVPHTVEDANSGNPWGAQEWRSRNYCACRPECKVRLGNVGGQSADPGSTCPATPCEDNGPSATDNFFWGRKP